MKITIIGCGNMGLIYARAFLKYNIVSKDELLLVEKNELRKEGLKKLNIGQVVVPDSELITDSDVIILSVKPQDFTELSADLKKVMPERTILLSIMAGITISFLQQKRTCLCERFEGFHYGDRRTLSLARGSGPIH